MNGCYNYGGCGYGGYYPVYGYNPFSCGSSFGGSGGTWFAIVLVVFLLLIICGCTKVC
ncbi:MAG: hypothetical protein LUG46_04825 [Erysipelotrichaceae bacterium]|nr:hypothetical protein [Erysipelotrichaceae bacterium]